ncbi:MAG: UDP-3-O-(3-hydroxymyristoyl)glucosamine N-acyltransferase [Gammaproteobacteria bacterium]|jgi:UDP-3-O-[3-hydroxymyristoyl] glucosamine N-acyltransferase
MLQFASPVSLQELALKINADLKLLNNLDNNYVHKNISSIETIEKANSEQVTFLANPLYAKYLLNTNAAAVIIHPKYLDKCKVAALVTNNPRLSLAKLLSLCERSKNIAPNIHNSCVIGKNVKIGKDVTIEAGVVIGDNCSIGNNTIIKANVVLYNDIQLGSNCLIHSNTVIGSDGFGFAQDEVGEWVKMPHLGGVIIEDHVEIGSNTSIDRGCIGDTIIKRGVIIDNLVQIAHNVVIGEYTAIAGCTGIAGSTVIGKRCLIGGASNIAGHLVITDEVHITATSSINKSLLKPGIYSSGLPARDNITWRKNIARFNMLDQSFKDLLMRVKILEKN